MPITSAEIKDQSQIDFSGIINSSKEEIEGIVGNVHFNDPIVDFAGISETAVPLFKQTVNNYRIAVQSIIDGFDPYASTDSALKGKVADAVHGFLEAGKELLKKYVQAIDLEIKEIDKVASNYSAAAGSISTNIDADANTLRTSSNSIELE